MFFSRSRFLEGGFTFQWGAFAFQLGGASFLSEEVQVDWTPSLVLKKSSLKHATKMSIWAAWTEISKNDCTHDDLMHLYINQPTKQVFSKYQPATRNWMRGWIYVMVNSIPVLIIYVTRNLQTKSTWILTLTHLAN